MTERFSDREIADLLDSMTDDDDQVLREAYSTDAFFGSRGLRVGIRRMMWAQDGLLPGFKLVDGEMVVTRSEILDTVPSDANMDLATPDQLETQVSYTRQCADDDTVTRPANFEMRERPACQKFPKGYLMQCDGHKPPCEFNVTRRDRRRKQEEVWCDGTRLAAYAAR